MPSPLPPPKIGKMPLPETDIFEFLGQIATIIKNPQKCSPL